MLHTTDALTLSLHRDSRDDGEHNLVTVVMHQFNIDIQSAFTWIGNLHDSISREFLDEWEHIPTFQGPLDLQVRTYCQGLGSFVRGNDAWSFEVTAFSYAPFECL